MLLILTKLNAIVFAVNEDNNYGYCKFARNILKAHVVHFIPIIFFSYT